MNDNLERIKPSVNWGGKSKRVSLLLVLALLLSLVLPTLSGPAPFQIRRRAFSHCCWRWPLNNPIRLSA